MRRREFIAMLGGATAAWPLTARAQQLRSGQRVPHVGILNYAAAQDSLVGEFRSALRELDRVEGPGLAITYPWADGQLERLPLLATELVATNVDVLIALGPASWAAKRATSTIPIVMAFSGDPVGNGVVTNLARPGGNITGFSYMSTDLAAKRLDMLYRAFSKNARLGILYNPGEPATELEMRETEAAARTIGVVKWFSRHASHLRSSPLKQLRYLCFAQSQSNFSVPESWSEPTGKSGCVSIRSSGRARVKEVTGELLLPRPSKKPQLGSLTPSEVGFL